jgi:metal-responsive CopG/Arc/MetJ family transcriptional regulator
MVSKTSGGLVKFSVAFDEELLEMVDRLAADRGGATNRTDVVRELCRLGAPSYEQQTAVLRSMSPQSTRAGAA